MRWVYHRRSDMAVIARSSRATGGDQKVRFCRAPDGTRLAYVVHGSGPPLVVASCWLSHLQHDWQSPVWRHFLEDLGQMATVIRYGIDAMLAAWHERCPINLALLKPNAVELTTSIN
jgi:hypothetical protein